MIVLWLWFGGDGEEWLLWTGKLLVGLFTGVKVNIRISRRGKAAEKQTNATKI